MTVSKSDSPGSPNRFDSARLDAQALFQGGIENKIMASMGLSDNMRVLDVGCGNGAVAQRLRQGFSGLEIHGIEVNPELASQATSSDRVDAVHVFDAVGEEWKDLGVFDCVFTRLVLQHISLPELLVTRMSQVVKPYGIVVLIEADHTTFLTMPRLEILDRALHRCQETSKLHAPGCEPFIGNRLPELARKAGLTDLETRIVTMSSREFAGKGDPAGTKFLGQSILTFLWSPAATGESEEWCHEVRHAYSSWADSQSYFRWSLLFVRGRK